MSLDIDLATYSFELAQLEQKSVFERGSVDNERYYKLKAEIAAILREFAKNG